MVLAMLNVPLVCHNQQYQTIYFLGGLTLDFYLFAQGLLTTFSVLAVLPGTDIRE